MNAVDTNVTVRILMSDSPSQGEAIRLLMTSSSIWISKTVLLETAWVLKSVYGFDETSLRDALITLLGIENVQVEDESSVLEALELTKQGIELSDAMNVCGRPANTLFMTFNKSLVRHARRAGVDGVTDLAL